MALQRKDADEPVRRAPWRGLVVGAVAALVFIFGLAIAAFATNDTTRGVPPHDAGFVDAGFVDAGEPTSPAGPGAGFVDAGELIGAAGPPDAGRIDVAGPPVDATGVAQVITPIMEECLKSALRFDPSLGGTARVHVVIGARALVASMPGASSPVLASCVGARGKLAYPQAPTDPIGVDAVYALDGLRQTVRLTTADITAP